MKTAARAAEPISHPVAGVVRRQWWIVAIVWAVTIVVTIVVTARQTPVYRASTSLVVVPDAKMQEPADVLRSLDTLDRRTIIATLARLPMTPESRAAAAGAIGVAPADLRDYAITAGVVPSANIIKIDVEGADAERAAAFCNAVAGVMSASAPQLYRIFTLQVIERAVPRPRPVRPDMRRNLVVGAIAGLLIGAAFAAGADYVRRRVAP
jgi:capsular polysaccharide biosynthesis protein